MLSDIRYNNIEEVGKEIKNKGGVVHIKIKNSRSIIEV